MRARLGDATAVRRAAQTVHMQPKAFQFLELLLENRPKALSKQQIHERLWPGTFISDSTLTSLLVEVRDVIGDEARHPLYVRTVHRLRLRVLRRAPGKTSDVGPSCAPARKWSCWVLHAGKRTALDAGRSRSSDGIRRPCFFIDHPSVSRRHARILVADGSATLEDLGSKNGTQLDDQKVESAVALADGARIRRRNGRADVPDDAPCPTRPKPSVESVDRPPRHGVGPECRRLTLVRRPGDTD